MALGMCWIVLVFTPILNASLTSVVGEEAKTGGDSRSRLSLEIPAAYVPTDSGTVQASCIAER